MEDDEDDDATLPSSEMVVKCSLEAFCPNNVIRQHIVMLVERIHRVQIETYHLIHLDIRRRYEEAFQKGVTPVEAKWTQDRVMKFMYAATTGGPGQPSIAAATTKKNFYLDLRKDCNLLELECRANIPGNSIKRMANMICASIITNIQTHFFKRQLKYLRKKNGTVQKDGWIKSLPFKKGKKIQDSINDLDKGWNHETLPKKITKSVGYTLSMRPESFLYPMWIMNKFLYENNQKTFSILPLSKGFVPSSILQIDTDSLSRILSHLKKTQIVPRSFVDSNERPRKKQKKIEKKRPKKRRQFDNDTISDLLYLYDKVQINRKMDPNYKAPPPGRSLDPDMMDEKDFLWCEIFEIENVLPKWRVKKGNLRFAHMIATNGVSVSVHIHRLDVAQRNDEIKFQRKQRKEEIEKKYPNKNQSQKEWKKESARLRKEKKARQEKRLNKELENYKDIDPLRVIGVDPGKVNIVYMTNESSPSKKEDEKGSMLEYTSKQRVRESKTKTRNKRLEYFTNKHCRKEIEELSKTNSRATSMQGFQEYLTARYKVQTKLYEFYRNVSFRITKWKNWKDRRSSEDKFINSIEKTFGKDAILAYGTWKQWTGMKGQVASPTNGFRNRVRKKFKVFDVPEWNTSKTCSRCFEEMDGDIDRLVQKKKKKKRFLEKEPVKPSKERKKEPARGIRRCDNEKCKEHSRTEFNCPLRWNRDHNAAINIRNNLLYRMKHDCWDPTFSKRVDTSKEEQQIDVPSENNNNEAPFMRNGSTNFRAKLSRN